MKLYSYQSSPQSHPPDTIVSPRPEDNRTNADYDKSFSMVEFNTDRSHSLVKCAAESCGIRIRSRRSSINRASSCKLRLMTSKSERIVSGRSGYRPMVARIAKIGVSGVPERYGKVARFQSMAARQSTPAMHDELSIAEAIVDAHEGQIRAERLRFRHRRDLHSRTEVAPKGRLAQTAQKYFQANPRRCRGRCLLGECGIWLLGSKGSA